MNILKKFVCVLALTLCGWGLHAQDATMAAGRDARREAIAASLNYGLYPHITNVSARTTICLDGLWKSIVDQYENGYYDYRLKPAAERNTFFADRSLKQDPTKLVEYDFDNDGSLQVPGDWNTQDPRFYYYEGTIWYRKKFDLEPKPGKRYFLYFGAVNYETIVGVNGKVLAKHTGGYTPFNFEITSDLKKGSNTVVAKVDNKRHPEGVPTVNSDWWNYGGITRSVYVVETPAAFVREYCLELVDLAKGGIKGWVKVDGATEGMAVTVAVPELKVKQQLSVDARGYASFECKAKPVLWCPENPKLYDVCVATEYETLADRIGFRKVETSGNKILLNGKEIFCRGVSVHEEIPGGTNGRAYSREHAKTLIGWAKEMNCNFLRLAHYPHNENMVREAEEQGIMLWSEVPVYWTIHWTNPDTYANAEAQLVDMITRDRNRANIIIWSVANETPRSPERLEFLSRLVAKAREMDSTRLVSAAMEKVYLDKARTHCTVNDELAQVVDLMSFNQYVGWYDGASDKCDKVTWTFEIDKPVFISEFGAGAKYNLHGDRTERFTEEYMEYLYEKNIGMLSRIPGLSGTTPWILKDFRSPRRQLKDIQDDYNRKGLISEYGERKSGFYVMQRWYESMK